jgi:hypothetical protein
MPRLLPVDEERSDLMVLFVTKDVILAIGVAEARRLRNHRIDGTVIAIPIFLTRRHRDGDVSLATNDALTTVGKKRQRASGS